MQTAKKNNSQFILCYLDLDNLKHVNDTLGHNTGDEYILQTVASIRKHIRSYDTICRVGGDEFVIVLPNYTVEKANHLCQMVNRDLQNCDILSTPNVGVSCGMSVYDPMNPVTEEKLIADADQMMYRKKQKNQLKETI